MKFENHGDEGRLDKPEARNEAIKIQDWLYGWSSPQLRSHKGFEKKEYQNADLMRDQFAELLPIFARLPKTQPERKASLDEIIGKYPPSVIAGAWSEFLRSNYPRTQNYQKFSDYSRLLFEETERNFTLLKVEEQKKRAVYNSPSNFYMPLAAELYNVASGKPYLSPQELKYNFEDGLRGKKVLEIAPGPGWFMKILQDSGAIVKGIDKDASHDSVARAWNLDIQKGDANRLNELVEGGFDFIISNNFITSSLIDGSEARGIIRQILQKLKPGGISINSTQNFPTPLELWALMTAIHDHSKISQTAMVLDNPPAQETLVEFDGPVLTDDDIKSLGVEDYHSSNENGYVTFSFKKP